MHKLIHGSGMPEGFCCPREIVFGGDSACLKLVLAFEDFMEPLFSIGEFLWDQSFQAGYEIHTHNDAANVKKNIHTSYG